MARNQASAAQCQSAGFSAEAHTSAARTRLRMDEASGPAVVSHRGIDSTQAVAIEALGVRRCGRTPSIARAVEKGRLKAWRRRVGSACAGWAGRAHEVVY